MKPLDAIGWLGGYGHETIIAKRGLTMEIDKLLDDYRATTLEFFVNPDVFRREYLLDREKKAGAALLAAFNELREENERLKQIYRLAAMHESDVSVSPRRKSK